LKRLACLLALLALAAGCGGGGGEESATDILSETADNLGEIRSGDLSLELLFAGRNSERQGFRLEGPFSLNGGGLPVAELDYVQIAGAEEAQVRFISTGGQAFVEVGGTAYELPPQLVGEIKEATGDLETDGLGERIELGNWIENPSRAEGGTVGGADTDRIAADLNVVNVVNGLVEIAAAFRGTESPPRVEGEAAEQLRRAVDAARIEVYTGKEDRLLRRLVISMEFSPEAPDEVKNILGVSVDFDFAISDPNKDVNVSPPTNVRPYSDLVGE
jgi:hypothetical protein